MGYDWDFSFLAPYTGAFIRGTWVTLVISFASFFIGTLVGIPMGMIIRIKHLKGALLPLNDLIRAIPVLVLIFMVYYFPFRDFFGIPNPSAILSGIIAIAISQAAYTADLVRAAVDGVSPRIFNGGRALGLKERTIWRTLILPDIFRQVLPAEVAFFLGIIRISNLCAVIGAPDVVFVARIATSQSFRSLEAWVLVALIYAVLILPITALTRCLEKSEWLKRRW